MLKYSITYCIQLFFLELSDTLKVMVTVAHNSPTALMMREVASSWLIPSFGSA